MKEKRDYALLRTPGLSLRRKADLLEIHLSGAYYRPKGPKADEVDLMNEIQEIYSQYPFMGYRRITVLLNKKGYVINQKRVLRLMQVLGLQALYAKKNLSKRRLKDAVYPYLLKENPPQKPNDAWQVDITYIRMNPGFLYLTALIDVISRKVMGWHLSPFLETGSCLKAFEMAFKAGFMPDIINSDQGCQFTSSIWTQTLRERGIQISMDGVGRCLDNIYIERFWKSLKYEEVYLKTYDTVQEARHSIGVYIEWYNAERPHQSLNYKTPNEVFFESMRPMDNGKKLCFSSLDHRPHNHNLNEINEAY